MKVKTRLHGVWVPWPCLNYTKRRRTNRNWKYLMDIKWILMCLSNCERKVFNFMRPPSANLLGLTVMWNTSKNQTESLKIHYEQISDSAFSLTDKTRISWTFPFWKSFLGNMMISLLKAKSSFQLQSIHTVGRLPVCCWSWGTYVPGRRI